MLAQESQLLFLIVFFIYGLAFFVMGIALLLETSRFPSLAEIRLLWPLAVFGVLHGMHEWVELFLQQVSWMEPQVAETISITRHILLAISFISLGIYGAQASQITKRTTLSRLTIRLIIFTLYFFVISYNALKNSASLDTAILLNNLIRYLLAVPAASLAAIGLWMQAQNAQGENRLSLAINLKWTAIGFGIYAFSQLFVSPLNMFPSNIVNSYSLFSTTGIPPEVIRTVTALIITIGLVRAIQTIEVERQRQLSAAYEARAEMRRDLLRHTVQAQEDERSRISRELHDETAQVLSAFSLGLATLSNKLDKEQRDLVPIIDNLQNLGKDMSQGIYRLVHDLRPAQLDDLGLLPAIQNLIGREYCKMELDVALDVEGTSQRVDPLLETVLFRVAQAALSNVSRHAQTQKAKVSISFKENLITLKITDNGIGFNAKKPFTPPRGWGLAGMRERVEAVNGVFFLKSSPGEGTSIEIIVPNTSIKERQGVSP